VNDEKFDEASARAQVEEYNKKISQMQESSQITAGKTIKIRRHHDGGGSSYAIIHRQTTIIIIVTTITAAATAKLNKRRK
jgi:hypothetical protein